MKKQSGFGHEFGPNFGALFTLLALLACGGCLSISDSPTPRFYALQAMAPAQDVKKINLPKQLLIGVGPVKLPEYLNRPQMVTQNTNSLLTFAQFDRWGEPLEFALPRVIAENLSAMTPDATFARAPWDMDMPLNYQVIMDIVRMDSRLDGDLRLTVQWAVINPKNRKMLFMKKSEIVKPIEPRNYAGLAETLGRECATLSAEIAEELASLAVQDQAKTNEFVR